MTDDTASLIRCGTVVALDLGQGLCRVAYGDPDSDEDAETGWISWLAPRAGSLKIWSPPSEGEQVLLLCPDGQLSAAVALPGLWRDIFAPPSAEAEDLIEWEDGAKVRYSQDSKAMEISLPEGGTLTAEAEGGITLRGPVTIEGTLDVEDDVTVTGQIDASGKIEAEGDVIGQGVSLKQHRHSAVQSGPSQSGPPA